jgi:hypothetical protein
MTIALGGTFIIAIPTKEGVVIAAESRRCTSNGYIRDGVTKIHSLSNRVDLAFFATGNTLFWDNPPENVSLNEWHDTATIRYDVISVLNEYLTKHAPYSLSENSVIQMSEYCKQHLINADRDNSLDLVRAPKQIYEAVVVQYKASLKNCIIGHFALDYDASVKLTILNRKCPDFPAFHPARYFKSGATKLLDHPAFSDLAPAGYSEFLTQFNRMRVGELSVEDAIRFARQLIETAIKVASLPEVNLAMAVGGPIFTYVLDGVNSLAGIDPVGTARIPADQPQHLADSLYRKG